MACIGGSLASVDADAGLASLHAGGDKNLNDVEALTQDILACLDAPIPDDALVMLVDRQFAFEPIEGYQPPAPRSASRRC